MATTKVVLPKSGQIKIRLYTPHTAQKRLHNSKVRFRVCCCGRRFGKTLAALNEACKFAFDYANVNVVWIAPIYRQCKVVYRVLKKAFKDLIAHHSDTELRIEFVNGSVFEFYSSTNPDAMRGNKYHLVIFDETADIDEIMWTEVTAPLIADTGARVIFIGTPKGRNWFYFLFLRGDDPLFPDWESFTFPTAANPTIPRKYIEDARRDLPEDVFRQEFQAVFLEDSAGVFKGVDRCIVGLSKDDPSLFEEDFLDPMPGVPYVVGWDVAKYHDFSVFSVLNCATRHLDAFARFNLVEYTQQVQRAKAITDLYNNAYMLMDGTGVGDPVFEMARNAGISVDPYVYNNASKKILFEELQVAIQNQAITFPYISTLVGELRTCQYKLSPGRYITYEVPRGYTDDCINSLALANHAANQHGQIGFASVHTEEDTTRQVQQYDNPALMQRQLAASRLLGDVDLVATFGGNEYDA